MRRILVFLAVVTTVATFVARPAAALLPVDSLLGETHGVVLGSALFEKHAASGRQTINSARQQVPNAPWAEVDSRIASSPADPYRYLSIEDGYQLAQRVPSLFDSAPTTRFAFGTKSGYGLIDVYELPNKVVASLSLGTRSGAFEPNYVVSTVTGEGLTSRVEVSQLGQVVYSSRTATALPLPGAEATSSSSYCNLYCTSVGAAVSFMFLPLCTAIGLSTGPAAPFVAIGCGVVATGAGAAAGYYCAEEHEVCEESGPVRGTGGAACRSMSVFIRVYASGQWDIGGDIDCTNSTTGFKYVGIKQTLTTTRYGGWSFQDTIECANPGGGIYSCSGQRSYYGFTEGSCATNHGDGQVATEMTSQNPPTYVVRPAGISSEASACR